MRLEFRGALWQWQGPAPWHFVTVPGPEGAELKAAAAHVTSGWGMIPVAARIGQTSWKTSLFPKDGEYYIPVKAAVRRAERIEVGDMVTVELVVDG